MNIRTKKNALIISLFSLTLTACSGEDPAGTAETPTQPTSSSTSYACGDNFTSISVPGEISNTDIPESESHCFSFDAAADQTYTATLETVSGDADIYLYSSPDITTIPIDFSEEAGLTTDTVSVSANVAATYYIEVYGFNASTYNLILSSSASNTNTANNTKPVAVIPPILAGALGQQTLLDSRASTDADGDTLTANWELISKPANSSLAFAPQTGTVVGFDADVYGDYTFQLIVDDSIVQSDPVTTTVSVQHTFTPLAFRVTDAEYDSANDRAVLVSAESKALYTFDPLTRSSTEVALTYTPTSVSISPDGLFAAVGHNGNISYVDLSTGSVSKTFTVLAEVGDLVLDGNGYIHIFPPRGSSLDMSSINIVTGTETAGSYLISDGTKARLQPGNSSIYGANNGLSPSDIEKYDISTGPALYLYDSPYHGDYAMCGNLWFSEGGQRMFTRCGNVFKTSTDQSTDMIYNGALPNINGSIVSLSHSVEQGKLALIENDSFDASLLLDTHIHFYEDSYLNVTATVDIPYFAVNNEPFAAHGEHIFYNSDGTQYLAVVKADSASGLTADYAILTSPKSGDTSGSNHTPVADSGVNQAVILGNSVQMNGSLSSDADADPLSYTWEIASSPVGSAATIVNATTVSPQFTPDVAGTYTISLTVSDGSLTSIPDTIDITAVNSNEPFLLKIDYTVTDAEYSEALESLVMISPTDNRLYRFDTETYAHTNVELSHVPTAVSVSPDGLYAAVGHNGYISYVDLSTGSVSKTFTVLAEVGDLVLDGNGYMHIFPSRGSSQDMSSINIVTGTETAGSYLISGGTKARLHPGNSSIYGANNGLSPSDIEKYDISTGPAQYLYDSPYHGDYAMCGNLWFSEDGARIFTRCGNVFNSSTVQADDMTYNGTLANITTSIISLARTAEVGEIAIIKENDAFSPLDPSRDTKLHFYDYTNLTETGSVSLPEVTVPGQTYPSHGRFVFYNSNGTRYFSIVQADGDAALLHDYGIYIH